MSAQQQPLPLNRAGSRDVFAFRAMPTSDAA